MDRIRDTRDLLSGTGLLALSVLYFFASRKLPQSQDEPGPAFFPTLLAAALFLLATSILASAFRKSPRAGASGPLAKPLTVMLLTVGYAASYPFVGFVPATLGYTLLLAFVFGRGGLLHPALIATGTTGFIYLVLGWGLGIPL